MLPRSALARSNRIRMVFRIHWYYPIPRFSRPGGSDRRKSSSPQDSFVQGASQFILGELDVRGDAIVSQDFRGDQSRNRREDAEMIRTLDRMKVDQGISGGTRQRHDRVDVALLLGSFEYEGRIANRL